MNNRIFYIVLLGIFIIVVFAIFALQMYRDRQVVEAPVLNIYTNFIYGISFEYPTDYFLDEKEVGNEERRHWNIAIIEDTETNRDFRSGKLVDTEGPTSITVDVYQNDIDKQSVVGWINNSSDSNFKLSSGTYSSTTIDGTEAVRYSWDGLYRGDSIVFSHKQNIIMMSVTYLNETDRIKNDFDKLVSSFRLSN